MKSAKFGLALSLVFVLVACTESENSESIHWFSEADAETLRLTEEDIRRHAGQSKSFSVNGPIVEIIYPPLAEGEGLNQESRVVFRSPATFNVEFRENLAPIDFQTLEVRGRKFGMTRKYTDQVKPYLDGNKLLARNLELPKGKFLIEFDIEDTKGRKTIKGYFVESK